MRQLLVLFAVVLLFVGSLCDSVDEQFEQFVLKYQKDYESAEEWQFRRQVFEANLKELETLRVENPLATFGVNEFADLTAEEFESTYLSYVPEVDKTIISAPPQPKSRHPIFDDADPDPNNWDWNDAGVITPVNQQGQCGDCWAFAATETIESYWALAGYPLTPLSVEQVIDCNSRGYQCGGGKPEIAYQYTMKVGGLEPAYIYPYVAGASGNNSQCAFNSSDIVASISSFQQLQGEGSIYPQVSSAGGGPVTICVDAASFRGYTGGVMTSCQNQTLNHCVQLTGYANYGSGWPNAYWIVRNQWGTNWGINGYIYIAIGQDLCGLGSHVSYVTI